MKFNDSETEFIHTLITAGGSYTPDAGFKLKSKDRATARRLENRGVITIEQVDTGFRYSLVSQ